MVITFQRNNKPGLPTVVKAIRHDLRDETAVIRVLAFRRCNVQYESPYWEFLYDILSSPKADREG